eukprot:TRINITY_DN83382_c0_g1_i1.p1 TRINITY_DN83382_c0_g1~~TRINITY_DN83382_c0_g1_i1.p1  ORF type:complete len:321 (+),score=64.56 TRINITY_DN83382_c0_g1_i1:77-1039(+)
MSDSEEAQANLQQPRQELACAASCIGYKLVRKEDGRYFSLFAGTRVQYILGVPAQEEVRPHERGFYFSLSAQQAARVYVPGNGERVILRCKCEAPFFEYPGGKIVCSVITPLEEVAFPEKAAYGFRLLPLGARCASAPHRGKSSRAPRARQPAETVPNDPSLPACAPPARRRPLQQHMQKYMAAYGVRRKSLSARQKAGHATRIGYKLVAKLGEKYFSLFAGEQVEYELDCPVEAAAKKDTPSGVFFCLSPFTAAQIHVTAGGLVDAPKALLLCECEGPFVQYQGGKMACSQLTPREEILGWERFRGCPPASNLRAEAYC